MSSTTTGGARNDQRLAPTTPWNASWHLRAELARVLGALAMCLQRQRQRGRTPAGDAVRGMVIEEGEAAGLIAELASDLGTAPRAPDASPPHVRDQIAERADQGAAQGAVLPLRHARRAFDLQAAEYDALLLALAVEVDARFGRIVAYLNDHVGRTRPTLGLALAITTMETGSAVSAVGLADRPFLRDGLLDVEGDAPLPGLTVKVPRALVNRLAGAPDVHADQPWLSIHPPDTALFDRLTLDAHVRRDLTAWSDALRGRRTTAPLLLAGATGNGRATVGRAALFRAGVAVVQVDVNTEAMIDRMRAARREARWHDAAVLVRWPSAPSQPIDWAGFWAALEANRRCVVALSPDHANEAGAASPAEPAVVRLEEPDIPLRTTLWPALLPPETHVEESEIAELAARFPFGPGRIARSIRRAMADLSLRPPGERRLDFTSLRTAARVVDSATLGPLAQKMPLPYQRDELVVPPHVSVELDLAIAWVRHRHRVLHDWGFVRRVTMGHGLTALFSGPSGTGKTMAAQVLARELGLDLYRIDLSQIMSKYIGDTEKNLALVFGARVGILFFDEAEAVLGKRSEVKDAHDRYANIEIGYLLQRMEEYDGVTILATNRMQDIDDAFVRRLHVVIDFPMPSEADRLRIWQGMLPADAERAPDLDLRALAREFDISGGQIKNAALAGAYLAAAETQPIGMSHLRRAATRELVKSGKVVERP